MPKFAFNLTSLFRLALHACNSLSSNLCKLPLLYCFERGLSVSFALSKSYVMLTIAD